MRRTLLAFALGLSLFTAHPALASTHTSGTLTLDTTWTTAESPYLLDAPVYIPKGITLTIEPGVVVKMGQPNCNCYSNISVGGTLIAGTVSATDRVIFTSIHEDLGSDDDGTTTPPKAGDWRMISVTDGGLLSLMHTDVRYGGLAELPFVYFNPQNVRMINNMMGTVLLDDVDLAFAYQQAAYRQFYLGATTITNAHIHDTPIGLEFTGGTALVTDTTWSAVGTAMTYPFGTAVAHERNTGSGSIGLTGRPESDTILTPDGLSYTFGWVTVPRGVTLTILPGTTIKGISGLSIEGTLRSGTVTDTAEVSFTSFADDTAGGDTTGDGSASVPKKGDWGTVQILPGGIAEISHTTLRYGGSYVCDYWGSICSTPMLRNIFGTLDLAESTLTDATAQLLDSSGTTTITTTEFARGTYGVFVGEGMTTIHDSSIHETTLFGVYNSGAPTVDATHNWWGSLTGPFHPSLNILGTGNQVSDNVLYRPYLLAEPTGMCTPGTEGCNSNVLFLPGVAGSRLYQVSELESQRCLTDTGDNYFKRWLPLTDCDNEKLQLNTSGTSINHIVTKDAVGEAAGIPNIYASFLADLKAWRDDEKIIAGYSVVPYDWRLSVDDVLNKGRKNADGYIDYTQDISSGETPYIMSELLRMADSSRTGKVTIVTHSNGGLVAKGLMLQLRALGKEDLVDKIIFVAVPQVGTPEAVATLLHGSNVGQLGVISDKRQTRDLSQNMPAAYNLLPSEKYYQTTSATIPIATFDNMGLYTDERSHYGQLIGNYNELTNYLLGTEGRGVPEYSELNDAAKANNGLLSASAALHASLDVWIPESTTKVIEVAGVGEYTIAGLQYLSETYCSKSHDETTLFSGTQRICDEYAQKKILKDVKTINGDATVVSDSAHYLSDKNTLNAERWWLNLEKHNSIFSLNKSRVHKDIFEVDSIRDFIKNQITDSPSTLDYISSVQPTIHKSVIKYDLHSPLSLSLFDDQGRHTGISTTTGYIEENIPGTRYLEVGETKEIIADTEIVQHLVLRGYASGSFSLGVEKLEGDTVIASSTFSAIPSSTSTVVTFDLPPNANLNAQATTSPLQIDFNGDGVVDTKMIAKPNQETVYDVTPPEVVLSFDTTKQSLQVVGYDSVSSTTVVTTASSIKVTDMAGNSTELLFVKYQVKPKKIELVISEIKQNGLTISTSTIPLTYKWNILTRGTRTTIKALASYSKTASSSVETHYRPKRDLTAVMARPIDLDDSDDGDDVDLRPTREKLQGAHIIKLRIVNGKSVVSY